MIGRLFRRLWLAKCCVCGETISRGSDVIELEGGLAHLACWVAGPPAAGFYCDMAEAHYQGRAKGRCQVQCAACANPPHFATYYDGRPAPNRRPGPGEKGWK